MKPDCQFVTDALLDYECLDSDTRAAVDAHLVECAACHKESELMEEMNSMFGEVQPVTVPADFAEQVMRRITDERLAPSPRSPVPVLCGILALQFVLIRLQLTGMVRLWDAGVELGASLFGDWIPALVTGLVTPLVEMAAALPGLLAVSVGPGTTMMAVTAVLAGLALGLSMLRHVEPLFQFEGRR